MGEVDVGELRNHGGEVIDRVVAGETAVITRSGVPVARRTRLEESGVDTDQFFDAMAELPPVDFDRFRADADTTVDPAL